MLLLSNCRIWDVNRPDPTELSNVLVEDGEIVDAGDRSELRIGLGPNDREIDLAGRCMLPGLWDAHAHLALAVPQTDLSKQPPQDSPVERAIRAGRNALDALNAGVTSIRVVGEAYHVDIAWKRAFESEEWVGPNLFVCGQALTTTGGHEPGLGLELDGSHAFVRGVREQLKRGADQIKVMLTGGIGGSPDESPADIFLSAAELRAVVATAHDRGVKVGAHVGSPEGAKMACREGVDFIEHGYDLDEEAIEMMVKSEVYLVPTLSVTQQSEEAYRAAGWSEYAIENGRRIRDRHLESVQSAIDAGVRIAAGDDTSHIASGLFKELEMLGLAGMASHEILNAATVVPATMCGVAEEIGTVETGKVADLIVVDGEPFDGISKIGSVSIVVKSGKVVRNSQEGST